MIPVIIAHQKVCDKKPFVENTYAVISILLYGRRNSAIFDSSFKFGHQVYDVCGLTVENKNNEFTLGENVEY